MNDQQQRKAVALISGGLDSMLAAKVIIDQGIHVEGINFFTGFCHSGHTSAIRHKKQQKVKRNDALWVAEQLGIKLHIIDIVEEYKQIVTNPKHGYGQHANPCLDCKVFMVSKAHQWMQQHQFDFIITGEVVGQRPMSQIKGKMALVSERSGSEQRLLRPLCAKKFPETLPEMEGWVDREKLFDFHGRNRKPQIELAKQFGIDEFAQPSGGCCVLTDDSYCHKLKDMWNHRGKKEYSLDDIILLKVGRHIRPNARFKLMIGREEGENNFLEGYRKQFTHIRIDSHQGPLTLIEGQPNQQDLQLAARIAARYSAGRHASQVTVTIHHNGEVLSQVVEPLAQDQIPSTWAIK